MADVLYTIHLTLEELRAIKRIARHLARGVDEHRKFVHVGIEEYAWFDAIFTKLSKSVAERVLSDGN